jgi:hypothetical protein
VIGAVAKVPLPYRILLAFPSKFTLTIFPRPVIFAPLIPVRPAPLATIFVTDNVLVVLLNVKFALPANELASLNWTCVLDPAALVVKTYGDPFAYSKLSVFTFPAVIFDVMDALANVKFAAVFTMIGSSNVKAISQSLLVFSFFDSGLS